MRVNDDLGVFETVVAGGDTDAAADDLAWMRVARTNTW
jgi:hypothetical protein